jgi:hypothetical protein
VNTGEQTIEWLYHEQLKINDEWAIRTPNGFKWWADKNVQTIEVIGEETGPNGEIASLISIRTDFLCNLELTDHSLAAINALLMVFAAMAGPVYDAEKHTLELCSLVRVHPGISTWMNSLLSVAAVLQIAEARLMANEVARVLGAQEAVCGHPEHGIRQDPDQMVGVVAGLIVPMGKEPCKWSAKDFQDLVDQYMQGPPSLGSSADGPGCVAEFPYGERSSLCLIRADQPHPRYGSGLFLLQSFPVGEMSDAEGAKLALSLNTDELTVKPSGYGFGSFVYRDESVHFTSFLPNATYGAGLLPNIYFANANRAREMAIRLKKHN